MLNKIEQYKIYDLPVGSYAVVQNNCYNQDNTIETVLVMSLDRNAKILLNIPKIDFPKSPIRDCNSEEINELKRRIKEVFGD